ncbi:MAG: L,D-transpeptidase [Polyangiaceae bacterium]|nr:L,D-transpeptidase [Polyangiaceae bacterium]
MVRAASLRRPTPPSSIRYAMLTCALVSCTEARSTQTVTTNPDENEKPALAAAPAPTPEAAKTDASATIPAAASAKPPAPAPEGPAEPRIWAKARFAWIHADPAPSRAWIGYLAPGTSVRLKDGNVKAARTFGGRDCNAWYAIEPRGYVCAGSTATIDENDPAVKILRRDAADTSSPWPYLYGESQGTPRYQQLPTRAEQRRTEPDLEKHEALVEKARAASTDDEVRAISKHFVGMDFSKSGKEPPELFNFSPLLREQRKFVYGGSTIAYVREFDFEGRTFLLTWDQAIVPKDRVKPYTKSMFHGLVLGKDAQLPLAFFREKPRPKYKRGDDGKLVQTDQTWPRHGWVELTGQRLEQDGKKFVETKEAGVYALVDDAQVIEQVTKAPWLGQKNPELQKWVDIRVLEGTLVAYEGLRPVYATMISPGRGGVPYEGIDPIKTASTPTGIFRVDGKFRTATMVSSSDDNLVHAEVNYVMNFHGPHALHGAYWHDGWGEKKSGGCVNLAPIDAKWVFDWTDPPVPEGWHGLRAIKEFGRSTIVRVRR